MAACVVINLLIVEFWPLDYKLFTICKDSCTGLGVIPILLPGVGEVPGRILAENPEPTES